MKQQLRLTYVALFSSCFCELGLVEKIGVMRINKLERPIGFAQGQIIWTEFGFKDWENQGKRFWQETENNEARNWPVLDKKKRAEKQLEFPLFAILNAPK